MGGEIIPKSELKSSYPVRSEGPHGKWIPNLYKDRIGQFYGGGQYEGKNLRAYVKESSIFLSLLINHR